MENQTETGYLSNERGSVSLENLFLDPNNYRFRDREAYKKVDESNLDSLLSASVQQRTRNLIVGKGNDEVDDVLRSLKANGFMEVDQIQVRKLREDAYLVIEGNRRVATLKFLQEQYQLGNDIGHLDPAIFSAVPVVVSAGLDASRYKILMGLKHISGNKKWPAVNQAELLKSLRDDGMSEAEIRNMLGITTISLRRLLRALSFAESYKRSDYKEQFRAEKFNFFYEAILQPKLMKWLEWNDTSYQATNRENELRFFSWISSDERGKESQEGEENEIVERLDPILTKGTDLRELVQFIDDEQALSKMEEARSISMAYLASDRFSANKFENTLTLLDKNLLAAIDFSRYATDESRERLPELKRKFDALLHVEGLNELVLQNGSLPTFGEVAKAGSRQREIFVKMHGKGFSEVLVSHYKALQGLKIQHLNRVNLFAGENNSGKSTLLEAIYTLAIQNDVDSYADLLRRRGKFAQEMPALWLNRQFDHEATVSGVFFDRQAEVRVSKGLEEEEFSTDYLSTLSMEAAFDGNSSSSRLRLFENRMSQSLAQSTVNLCRVCYSTPFAIHNQEALLTAFEQSVKENAKNRIVQFIRENIDSGFQDVNQVGEKGLQRFLVTHESLGEAVDLTHFGDGLQRIFHIALQFAACKNGVLLIDEIENAMHHSLFEQFVQLVRELSEAFNVQVFITSHSDECINAFFEDEAWASHLSAYQLRRDENGNIQCLYEEGPRYSRLIKNFGADLRG